MQRTLFAILSLFALTFALGCAPDAESQLGNVGERCFSSNDCAHDLFCDTEERECVQGDNSAERENDCAEICETLNACQQSSGCEEGCMSATAVWEDGVRKSFKRCLQNTECDALESIEVCLPDPDPTRLTACERVSSECGRSGPQVYENCASAAITHTDAAFNDTLDCLGRCGDPSSCLDGAPAEEEPVNNDELVVGLSSEDTD